MTNYLKETPWDERTFKVNTYELTSSDEAALQQTVNKEGHFTIKIDPLLDKELLSYYGFYYADTLLQPECKKDELQIFEKEGVTISPVGELDMILRIADQAFEHGRFHRDFQVPPHLADLRYVRWLEDLYHQGAVYFLYYQGDIAGFIGYDRNKILLMGMDQQFRGLGLSKPFLSKACLQLIADGNDQLFTSISAINLASLNLYYSVGFKLKGAVDVYHKLNGTILAE